MFPLSDRSLLPSYPLAEWSRSGRVWSPSCSIRCQSRSSLVCSTPRVSRRTTHAPRIRALCSDRVKLCRQSRWTRRRARPGDNSGCSVTVCYPRHGVASALSTRASNLKLTLRYLTLRSCHCEAWVRASDSGVADFSKFYCPACSLYRLRQAAYNSTPTRACRGCVASSFKLKA